MAVTENTLKSIVNRVVHKMDDQECVNAAVPIGVSQRHIHLTQEHLELLFGKGYELTKMKMLMGEEFAAKECVTIVGASLKSISDVRVLGPVRPFTQVEISRTDTFILKVSPPVRASGDVKGSERIVVVGPKGVIYLNEGCIIANRHIHMTEEDAKKYNLSDNEKVDVIVKSERPIVFNHVQMRIAPKSKVNTEMHIDTDEANSAGLKNGDKVYILKG